MSQHSARKFMDLAPTEVSDVISRYYAGERITDLLEEYHLALRPSELVKAFPPEEHMDQVCQHCGHSPLYSKRRSRTERQAQAQAQAQAYCPTCQHESWNAYCRCSGCEEVRQQQQHERAEQAARDSIARTQSMCAFIAECNSSPAFLLENLSLTQRVQLAALIRCGLSEKDFYLNPLRQHAERLAPTLDMEIDILRQLFHDSLIHLHPGNHLNAFEFKHEVAKSFFADRVFWTINLNTDGQPFSSEHIAILCAVRPDAEEHGEAVSLWKQIAAAECYDFLITESGKYDFDYKVGPKTVQVIDEMLSNFSVGEIFALASSAVRKAVAYFQEQRVPRQQAANSIIGNLQRYSLRALEEKWNVRSFRRRIEASALSQVLSYQVLGIGERIFQTPPGRLALSPSASSLPTENEARTQVQDEPGDRLSSAPDDNEDLFT